MDRNTISPQITIAELFLHYPQTVTFFLNHRMACVGCSMSEFDTLAEVASNYGMDTGAFITEIEGIAANGRLA